MLTEATSTLELAEHQLDHISELVKSVAGINLHDGKKELIKARLSKRLRTLGIHSFDEYFTYLKKDSNGNEMTCMLDAISTNLTSFFRENDHFDYLADSILPRLESTGQRKLRIWSAGCSTGEEPYTIAMTVSERLNLSQWDTKILATDLSTNVLQKAKEGIYKSRSVEGISPQLKMKYFDASKNGKDKKYQINSSLRQMITFGHLNLMGSWPMRGPLDVIFCRNVMIYFDKSTRAKLISRFWDLLAPGGTLLIGHSESLTGIQQNFKYVRPTIYSKN